MADSHGAHGEEHKKAETYSRSPKDYILNLIYLIILFIIIFSIKSLWKDYKKEKEEKEKFEAEIIIYEYRELSGENILFQGKTPISFPYKHPYKISVNTCGKFVEVTCADWEDDFEIYRDCQTNNQTKISVPDVKRRGSRINITTVK